jgi:hypothetical protein
LRVVPSAEFSVDDPMPNSSQLSLPTTTAPAWRSRAVTVASYDGTKRSRMREPAVVRTPAVQDVVLDADGHAGERPGILPGGDLPVDGLGRGERVGVGERQEGADRGLDPARCVRATPASGSTAEMSFRRTRSAARGRTARAGLPRFAYASTVIR